MFFRSSIKFQGHTGWKFDDLNPIWVRLLGRSQLHISNPSDLPCLRSSVKIPRSHETVQGSNQIPQLDSCDRPSYLTQIRFLTTSSFAHHSKAIGAIKMELQSGNPQFWSILVGFFLGFFVVFFCCCFVVFCPIRPWTLTHDLEKQQGTSATLLQALCIISEPSVKSNWIYNPETPNSVKIDDFWSPLTLKFDRWPWKIIGHFFYTLSCMHHFVAIGELKLELQSGNDQFESKSAIFLCLFTLKTVPVQKLCVNIYVYIYIYIYIYICMYIPDTSSVIGRIYNGSVIQYWRSCSLIKV